MSTPFENGCGAEGMRPGGPGLGGEQVRADFTVHSGARRSGVPHHRYLRPQRRVPSLTNAAVSTFSSKIQLKWGGRCTWSVAQCQLGSPVQAMLPLPWSQSLKASHSFQKEACPPRQAPGPPQKLGVSSGISPQQ